MKKIRVRTSKCYDVIFERGLVERLANYLRKERNVSKYAIVTDSNLKKIYGEKLLKKLKKKKISCCMVSFKAGEKSKNLRTVEKLAGKLVENSLDRKSVLIAFGGGIVGDLTGFLAAVYMRGISFIQIPTTLLAMVDSSIGGKTGVDLKQGKNLAGCFKQPSKVFVDVSFLTSLPEKEFKNGLVEAVKTAVIADKELFELMEKNGGKIKKRDLIVLKRVVERCIKAKAKIVERDEKEKNLRKILNYGHSIGHALETASNYSLSHGMAVEFGMMVEAEIARKLNGISEEEICRQNALLEQLCFKRVFPRINVNNLISLIRKDKKSVEGKLVFALPKRIGKMMQVKGGYGVEVREKLVKECVK